jgi:hypothetical protein
MLYQINAFVLITVVPFKLNLVCLCVLRCVMLLPVHAVFARYCTGLNEKHGWLHAYSRSIPLVPSTSRLQDSALLKHYKR